MYLQIIKENIHVSWVSTRSLCQKNTINDQSIIIEKNTKQYQILLM